MRERPELQHMHRLFAIAPLLVALLLSDWAERNRIDAVPQSQLYPVQLHNSEDVLQLFAGLDYEWPLLPGETVPPVAVDPLPADLAAVEDSEQRKSLFLRILLPMVMAENVRIRQQRTILLQILEAGQYQDRDYDRRWLMELAAEYDVDGETDDAVTLQRLLRRVDELPPSLVLAQAANESGWGGSRFAREGNNLFGQWTFSPELGLRPRDRDSDKRHYVRRFRNVRQSVRSYLNNINTSAAYRNLRGMREEMRAAEIALDGPRLAEGLIRYSQRGRAYVDEIRHLIVSNDLDEIGQRRFTAAREYLSALHQTRLSMDD